VVASVSCIYGLGKRKAYEEVVMRFSAGEQWGRRRFMEKLLENYYVRNDLVLEPGNFRVRGDVIEVYPAYSDSALRIAFFDDEIEAIEEFDPLTGKRIERKERAAIYPAQHYVTSSAAIADALLAIEEELKLRVAQLQSEGKLVEAQRLEARTRYDMEMMAEVGYCSGIENYSRYLDGRAPGEPPGTLLDFFPHDFLMVIDESHITVPQIQGMYNGDRARKETLVAHGFRLPSCLDNRPLRWEEFMQYMRQVIFTSATPGDWELEVSSQVVEQIVRPTGVLDPVVEVVPAKNQVDDLIDRLRSVVEKGERALVTTLTKRSAEDMAEYLADLGFKVRYIHSELDTFERAEAIRDLRMGEISVLVGVNLLREGLDLPEVTLVAILDADREGFLRSGRSLIQMIGRAARNTASTVVLYADEETGGLRRAVEETRRRRKIQERYNEEHGIVPETIKKAVVSFLPSDLKPSSFIGKKASARESLEEVSIAELERIMWEAVERLDFEEAAKVRDLIAQKRGGDWRRVAVDRSDRRKATQPKRHRRAHSSR
ncbi:MAG TPA: excinuclease ABC subunit B, partial [Synergistaceae bacterium]|nr:excinuclease ABC subunit B [Synergistaceae bacterium]